MFNVIKKQTTAVLSNLTFVVKIALNFLLYFIKKKVMYLSENFMSVRIKISFRFLDPIIDFQGKKIVKYALHGSMFMYSIKLLGTNFSQSFEFI